MALIIIVAVVFAAGGVGLGWIFFHADSHSGDAAERNVDMGCEIVLDLEGKVPSKAQDPEWKQKTWTIGGQRLEDVSAVGALFGGVAGKDPERSKWAGWGKDLISATSTMNLERIAGTYPKVLQACKDR